MRQLRIDRRGHCPTHQYRRLYTALYVSPHSYGVIRNGRLIGVMDRTFIHSILPHYFSLPSFLPSLLHTSTCDALPIVYQHHTKLKTRSTTHISVEPHMGNIRGPYLVITAGQIRTSNPTGSPSVNKPPNYYFDVCPMPLAFFVAPSLVRAGNKTSTIQLCVLMHIYTLPLILLICSFHIHHIPATVLTAIICHLPCQLSISTAPLPCRFEVQTSRRSLDIGFML